MGPILDSLPQAGRGSKGVLRLELSEAGSLPDSPEGYRLQIANGSAKITSRGEAGLFYGCQTLEQLLEDARDTGMSIPACEIGDWPALTTRAVQIDVKHHLDTMKYYYDAVDRLARYKINGIIFEFEDKLRYRRRPLVGGPLSILIEEMAALTRYARERHIEISPLVQGLGHASFILKHKEYAHLRENPKTRWAFCPLKKETYELQFDLYRDAMEATPGSPYLHVGGDEVHVLGECPQCKPKADKEGRLALYLHWLNQVSDFAKRHGRIPIAWDDVILKEAGVARSTRVDYPSEELEGIWREGVPLLDRLLERFPRDLVYMRWEYGMARCEGNVRALDWYRDRGLPAMIATAAQTGAPPSGREGRVAHVHSFITLAAEKGIDGMLCTAWDDSSPHMEMYWHGLIASAEFSWSPTARGLRSFEVAYLQRELGPECVGAAGMEETLSSSTAFRDQAFLVDGATKRHFRKAKDVIDLPDPAAPGTWTKKHSLRLAEAEKHVPRHDRLARQLAGLSGKARRNRSHLEVLSAVNDLAAASSRILLALRDSDVAGKRKREQGVGRAARALAAFDEAWAHLQEVYSRTRFLAYPKGYVADRSPRAPRRRQYHVAAQREDLTWMVMVEKEFCGRVKEWLQDISG